MSDHIPEDLKQKTGNLPRKMQIICKFWMMGTCNKDEKCEYLHNNSDFKKGKNNLISPECPFFSLGFCKSGPLCKFKHTKLPQEENPFAEIIENDSPNENLEGLPLFYLEYILEKPIGVIFEEFEKENKELTQAMKSDLKIEANFNIFDSKQIQRISSGNVVNNPNNYYINNFMNLNSGIIKSNKNDNKSTEIFESEEKKIEENLENSGNKDTNKSINSTEEENEKDKKTFSPIKYSYKDFKFNTNIFPNYNYPNFNDYKNYINSTHFQNGEMQFNFDKFEEKEKFFSQKINKNFINNNPYIMNSIPNPQNLKNKFNRILPNQKINFSKQITNPKINQPNEAISMSINPLFSNNQNFLCGKTINRMEIMNNLLTKNYQNDIYAYKKIQILNNLNQNIKYFFLRYNDFDLIRFSMETDLIITTKENSKNFLNSISSAYDVILVYFDDVNKDFYGFSKVKFEVEEIEVKNYLENSYDEVMELFKKQVSEKDFNEKASFIKIEWLWKTKLSFDKVEILRNPLDNYDLFINSKDGQEIYSDLGFYVCRLMIKRLTKEEVQDYLNTKKFLEMEKTKLDGNVEKENENNFMQNEYKGNCLNSIENNDDENLYSTNKAMNLNPYIQNEFKKINCEEEINKDFYLFQNKINQENFNKQISHTKNYTVFNNEENKNSVKTAVNEEENIQKKDEKIKTINIKSSNLLNLNNLTNEENEISEDFKNNLNEILIKNINKQRNSTNNNNIIVTNISNLQVNISQNSYNNKIQENEKTEKNKERKKKEKRSKKNIRSNSISREKDRNFYSKENKRKFSNGKNYNILDDEMNIDKLLQQIDKQKKEDSSYDSDATIKNLNFAELEKRKEYEKNYQKKYIEESEKEKEKEKDNLFLHKKTNRSNSINKNEDDFYYKNMNYNNYNNNYQNYNEKYHNGNRNYYRDKINSSNFNYKSNYNSDKFNYYKQGSNNFDENKDKNKNKDKDNDIDKNNLKKVTCERKIRKNKLFSNAIEKVTMSYQKEKTISPDTFKKK